MHEAEYICIIVPVFKITAGKLEIDFVASAYLLTLE